jgi:hypothetical protein
LLTSFEEVTVDFSACTSDVVDDGLLDWDSFAGSTGVEVEGWFESSSTCSILSSSVFRDCDISASSATSFSTGSLFSTGDESTLLSCVGVWVYAIY